MRLFLFLFCAGLLISNDGLCQTPKHKKKSKLAVTTVPPPALPEDPICQMPEANYGSEYYWFLASELPYISGSHYARCDNGNGLFRIILLNYAPPNWTRVLVFDQSKQKSIIRIDYGHYTSDDNDIWKSDEGRNLFCMALSVQGNCPPDNQYWESAFQAAEKHITTFKDEKGIPHIGTRYDWNATFCTGLAKLHVVLYGTGSDKKIAAYIL